MIRRLLLVLAVLVGAWLVACAFLFVWPKTDKPGRADAVVVLSGGGDRRLDPALALVRRGVAPLLVISSPALDPKWLKAKRPCRHPEQPPFRRPRFGAVAYNPQAQSRASA